MAYGDTTKIHEIDAYDGRDKRALQYLVSLGERNVASLVALPNGCENQWAHWNPVSGVLEIHDIPIGPSQPIAGSLEAFRDICLDVCKAESRVYVGVNRIVAVIAPDRRETVSLPLSDAEEWAAVCAFAGQGWKQAQLLTTLRTKLSQCDPGKFTSLVRELSLESADSMSAAIGSGMNTVSASAQRKAMMGGREVPETVEFIVPRYAGIGIDGLHTIRCAVDIEFANKQIVLKVLAGELSKAHISASGAIAEYLRNGLKELCVKVWCGTPQ